jgi:hypothetical protein
LTSAHALAEGEFSCGLECGDIQIFGQKGLRVRAVQARRLFTGAPVSLRKFP